MRTTLLVGYMYVLSSSDREGRTTLPVQLPQYLDASRHTFFTLSRVIIALLLSLIGTAQCHANQSRLTRHWLHIHDTSSGLVLARYLYIGLNYYGGDAITYTFGTYALLCFYAIPLHSFY